jgi:hypothetical protein
VSEAAGLVADLRTPVLDEIAERRFLTLGGDPRWVDFWVARLDSNCCLSFHAEEALRAVFPTLPAESGAEHLTPQRRLAERWFARHRGRFVWSRLLDGWVPGPGPDGR